MSSIGFGRLTGPVAAAVRPASAGLLMLLALCGSAQTTPAPRWTVSIDLFDSTPAIGSDGTLYFGTFHQKFYAVSSNGVVRWTLKTGSEIKSSPAIGADGTIYFGCRDRKLYAVSPHGKKKWEFAAGGWVDSSPALARDGAICFGSWDKRFYALKPGGSLTWQFETGGPIDSSPAIGADETIYFGSHDRKFYALTRDGAKRWEYATGGPIISSPALNGDGVIYFTSVDGFLYALTEEGRLKWRLHTGGITASSPVIGPDGVIYVGVNDSFWAVTPDGATKGMRRTRDLVESAPAVTAADTVYVLPRTLDLVALDSELRVVSVSSPLYGHGSPSPVIGPGGVVYVPDRWNNLSALEAGVPAGHTPWPKFRADARNTGHATVSVR